MRQETGEKVETSGAAGDSADRRAWHAGSGPGPEPTRQPPTWGGEKESGSIYIAGIKVNPRFSIEAQRKVDRACILHRSITSRGPAAL